LSASRWGLSVSCSVVPRSRKGSGKTDCADHFWVVDGDSVTGKLVVVVLIVVVVSVVVVSLCVVVVVVVVVVEEVVDVTVVVVEVEIGTSSVVVVEVTTLFVVTILLIGAMSSRKGRSGAEVEVDALLADSVVADGAVAPISWSMANQVNNWFLSGAAVVARCRVGGRARDSRETTLPLPRMMEGTAAGSGWRLSMNMLLVSLL